MRVAIYPIYWLLVAPIILIVTLDLLVYPSLAVILVAWGEDPPALVTAAVAVLRLFALALAIGAVVWFWRRVKASTDERTS